MKALAPAAGPMIAVSTVGTQADIVTLSFNKDICEKFLQSEPLDQTVYLAWASGHIRRKFDVGLDSAALSQPLRTYCAANPSTLFVDATEAVEIQLTTGTKP